MESNSNFEKFISLINSCKSQNFDEKWVNSVDEICNSIKSVLPHAIVDDRFSGLIDDLISIIFDGLDIEKASQQSTVFSVRHLKVGIRLASSLFRTNRKIAAKLCKSDLQHRLIDLLEDPITSVTNTLDIVEALDASLCFDVGANAFVGLLSSTKGIDDRDSTPYQRLTRFILGKRSTRVMVAAHCLMRKIVLDHSLKTVFNLTKKMAKNSVQPEMTTNGGEDQSDQTPDIDSVLTEEEIASLCENLIRITEFHKFAADLVAQPPPTLPSSTVFARRAPSANVSPALYGMFKRRHLLPSMYLLLSHWSIGCDQRIVLAIHQLLSGLMYSPNGLLFLASQRAVVQEMLEMLLQRTQDEDCESETSTVMQELALDMAYHLQALQYVDELLAFHKSDLGKSDVDNPIGFAVLQAFYVLALDQNHDRRGVNAVVRVLSLGENLGCILPFVELTGDAEWDNRVRKSASAGYASELLLLVLRQADSIDYLRTFQERLLAISSQEATSRIAEVKQWIEPFRKLPAFTYESIEFLAERIKVLVQSDDFVPRIPKELIMILRLIKHIAVEPPRAEESEAPKELRYNYALIQLYRFDIIGALFQIIEKLADSHLVNWQQGVSLNSKHGHLFYACVVPTVIIVRHATSYLINCRGTEYKDQSPIVPLLKLYTVCCTLVSSFGILPEGQTVQKEIVATLLAFAQSETAPISVEEAEEPSEGSGPVKSLWTNMISEILSYAMEAPYRYVTGLSILSELLPLPLPIPTKEALTDQEATLVQSHRRTWSSQLIPIADDIQSLIRDFLHSTQRTLQQDLRRVCVQLSDLSPEIAQVLVRAVVEVALENCETVEKKTNPNDPDEPPTIVRRELILPATSALARIFNLLSYMVAQSSFKACFLALLRARKEKQADDCSRLLQYMLTILEHSSVERGHESCQELIVGTLQSICDEEIGMIAADQNGTSVEQLAASLPDAQRLKEICVAILKHVRDGSQNYATILPALRIFVMLCGHDYGLDCIKWALENESNAFLALLERLLDEFSGHSSDCISTLSTLLLLLRSLQVVDDGAALRTMKIDSIAARKYLNWRASLADDHCLTKLKKMLADGMEEDSSLESLHDDVSNLIGMLSADSHGQSSGRNSMEPVHLPTPSDIVHQFNNRQVWTICNDPSEDRLQAHYWFPIDVFEEEDDQEADRVPIELEAMRAQYVPDFDLTKELADKILAKRTDEAEAIKRKIIPGIINTSRGERKRFVAPLRGRGMVPRGNFTSRMNDPFRSRIPNTSRPPSMHVDDFIFAHHTPHASNAPMGGGQGGGEAGHSAAGNALPKDNLRQSSNRGGGDRGNMGRPNRYRGPPSPMDDRGRNFPKPQMGPPPSGMNTSYRARAPFDSSRDRHQGGSSGRHSGKSTSRSSSSRKSPSSRHRASSK